MTRPNLPLLLLCVMCLTAPMYTALDLSKLVKVQQTAAQLNYCTRPEIRRSETHAKACQKFLQEHQQQKSSAAKEPLSVDETRQDHGVVRDPEESSNHIREASAKQGEFPDYNYNDEDFDEDYEYIDDEDNEDNEDWYADGVQLHQEHVEEAEIPKDSWMQQLRGSQPKERHNTKVYQKPGLRRRTTDSAINTHEESYMQPNLSGPIIDNSESQDYRRQRHESFRQRQRKPNIETAVKEPSSESVNSSPELSFQEQYNEYLKRRRYQPRQHINANTEKSVPSLREESQTRSHHKRKRPNSRGAGGGGGRLLRSQTTDSTINAHDESYKQPPLSGPIIDTRGSQDYHGQRYFPQRGSQANVETTVQETSKSVESVDEPVPQEQYEEYLNQRRSQPRKHLRGNTQKSAQSSPEESQTRSHHKRKRPHTRRVSTSGRLPPRLPLNLKLQVSRS